ncbi:MAG: HK97 family phage prohead protease [Cyclobacteriaceae bacterium]
MIAVTRINKHSYRDQPITQFLTAKKPPLLCCMSLKKTKPFVISSEAKNSAGFRVRTAGINLSQYGANPVMLYDHDPKQILGNGTDVHVDGVKLMFTPAFDTSDPDAEKIYNKVQNGSIRMSSAGLKPPFKWAKDEQGELWLEESVLRECTVCLFGANPEALAVQLYDEQNEVIELNEASVAKLIPTNINENTDMKTINLSASLLLPMVNLQEGATPEEVTAAIQKAIQLSETQAAKIVTLTEEKTTAINLKEAAVAELNTYKETAEREKLVNLVDTAVKEGKITADQKVDFLGDESKNLIGLSYEQSERILSKIAPTKSLADAIKDKSLTDTDKQLVNLSYDEAMKQDKLAIIKDKMPDRFLQICKDKFGDHFEVKS